MYQMKPETKQKYLADIRKIDRQYLENFPKLNQLLKGYGGKFYEYSQGKLTDSYFREAATEAQNEIDRLFHSTLASMLEQLKNLEKAYAAEMYAGNATTDQLELGFVSRELELMDLEELKEFYITNIGDENKRRLFRIEMKRRARSGDVKAEGDARILDNFVRQFSVGDEVSKKISERIRIYGGMVQIGGYVWVVNYEKENFSPRMFPFKEIFHAVEARAAFGYLTQVDFYELVQIPEDDIAS